MKKSKKIISVITLIAFALFNITACSTTIVGGVRKHESDRIEMKKSLEGGYSSDIGNNKTESLDDIKKNLVEYEKLLISSITHEKYKDQINDIYKAVESIDDDRARSLVKNLYNKIGYENNEYALDLRSKIKDFNYTKYEYTDPKYRVDTSLSKNPFRYLGVVGWAAMFIGFSPILIFFHTPKEMVSDYADLVEDITTIKKTTVLEKGYYRKIEVNPYYGTMDVAETIIDN